MIENNHFEIFEFHVRFLMRSVKVLLTVDLLIISLLIGEIPGTLVSIDAQIIRYLYQTNIHECALWSSVFSVVTIFSIVTHKLPSTLIGEFAFRFSHLDLREMDAVIRVLEILVNSINLLIFFALTNGIWTVCVFLYQGIPTFRRQVLNWFGP